MYYYSIGNYDFESASYVNLMHKSKISEEDFENMYVEAVVDVLVNKKGYLANHPTLEEGEVFPSDWEMDKDDIYYTGLYEILDAVSQSMIENFGFQKIEEEQSIIMYGFTEVVNSKCDGEEGEEDILAKIRDKFWKMKDESKKCSGK